MTDRPRRRTWLRFSLASLLVVMTMLCIALAVVFNRARRQERAVRAIEAAGGFILFDYHRRYSEENPLLSDLSGAPVPGPSWLRQLVGDELFRTPKQVTFFNYPNVRKFNSATDSLLIEHLSGMRSIDYLAIDSTNVTDPALPHIAKLSHLQTLYLGCPQVTDAGLDHLQHLGQLQNLALNCPQLTPDGVRKLSSLTCVVEVYCIKDETNASAVEVLASTHWHHSIRPPLLEALDELEASTGLPIDTTDLIPVERVGPLLVAEKATNGTVAECLDRILQPAGLDWYLDRGRVKITTPEIARPHRAGYRAFRETFPQAETIDVDW